MGFSNVLSQRLADQSGRGFDFSLKSLLSVLFGKGCVVRKMGACSVLISASEAVFLDFETLKFHPKCVDIKEDGEIYFRVDHALMFKFCSLFRKDPLLWFEQFCIDELDEDKSIYRMRLFWALISHDKARTVERLGAPISVDSYDLDPRKSSKFLRFLKGEGYGTRLSVSCKSSKISWFPGKVPYIPVDFGNVLCEDSVLDHDNPLSFRDLQGSEVSFAQLYRSYKDFVQDAEHRADELVDLQCSDQVDSMRVEKEPKEKEARTISNPKSKIFALEKLEELLSSRAFLEALTGDKMVSATEVYLMQLIMRVRFVRRGIEISKDAIGCLDELKDEIKNVLLVFSWHSSVFRKLQPVDFYFNITKAELRDFHRKLLNIGDDQDPVILFADDPVFLACDRADFNWNALIKEQKIRPLNEQELLIKITHGSKQDIVVSRTFAFLKAIYLILNKIPLISSLFASFFHPARHRIVPLSKVYGLPSNGFVDQIISNLEIGSDFLYLEKKGWASDALIMRRRIDAYREARGLVGGKELFFVKMRKYKVLLYLFYFFAFIILSTAMIVVRIGAIMQFIPLPLVKLIELIRGVIDSTILIVGFDTIVDFFVCRALSIAFGILSILDRILLGGIICSVVRLVLELIMGVLNAVPRLVFSIIESMIDYGLSGSTTILLCNIRDCFLTRTLLNAIYDNFYDWLGCIDAVRVVKNWDVDATKKRKALSILEIIPLLSLLSYIYRASSRIREYYRRGKFSKDSADYLSESLTEVAIDNSGAEHAKISSNDDEEKMVVVKDVQNISQLILASLQFLQAYKVGVVINHRQALFMINDSYKYMKLYMIGYVRRFMSLAGSDKGARDMACIFTNLVQSFLPNLAQLYCLVRGVYRVTFSDNYNAFLLQRFMQYLPVSVCLAKTDNDIQEVIEIYTMHAGYKHCFTRIAECLSSAFKECFDLPSLLLSAGFYCVFGEKLLSNVVVQTVGIIPEFAEEFLHGIGLNIIHDYFTQTDVANFIVEFLWPRIHAISECGSICFGAVQMTARSDYDFLIPYCSQMVNHKFERDVGEGNEEIEGLMGNINVFVFLMSHFLFCDVILSLRSDPGSELFDATVRDFNSSQKCIM